VGMNSEGHLGRRTMTREAPGRRTHVERRINGAELAA